MRRRARAEVCEGGMTVVSNLRREVHLRMPQRPWYEMSGMRMLSVPVFTCRSGGSGVSLRLRLVCGLCVVLFVPMTLVSLRVVSRRRRVRRFLFLRLRFMFCVGCPLLRGVLRMLWMLLLIGVVLI